VSSNAINLDLPETLTFATARAWVQLAEARLRAAPGADVQIDGHALRHFDTAALAALLACARVAREHDGVLTFGNGPAGLVSLASLYGVSAVLGISSAQDVGAPVHFG
jgi:ABC-type transporter Mla MlaB component